MSNLPLLFLSKAGWRNVSASEATALSPGANINGVLFTGGSNITVPAAAGTLTGTTLAANVLASSLTSLGTLTALSVTGAIQGGSFTSDGSNNWTLGTYNATAPSATGYVTITINSTTYKLLAST